MIVEPRPGRTAGRPQLITLGAGVLVFAAGVAGIALTVQGAVPRPERTGPADIAYRALQLFVLDGGALDGLGAYHPLLQAARFLAPAVTVGAVVLALRSLFANEWNRWQLSRLTGHDVICGDGVEAATLVGGITRAGRPAVLVTASRTGVPAGVRAVLGDPRDPDALTAAGVGRARAVYALDDSRATSTAIGFAAGRVERTGDGPLRVYARVRSANLVEGLRLQVGGAEQRATIDWFAVSDVAARAMLRKHPPGTRTPVVVGEADLANSVVRLLRRGADAVAGPCPDVVQVPTATAVDAVARTVDGPVYVCLPDPEDGVAAGLRLAGDLTRATVVALPRAEPFADGLGGSGRLRAFGFLDTGWTADAIAQDTRISRAARAIHENYRTLVPERADGGPNPSAEPWARIPSYLRESNIAQAEDIDRKLATIGATYGHGRPDAEFAFDDEEIEKLAVLEHRRWARERTARGYVYGPERTATTHPDLRDWADLTEEARDKDRATIRGLPGLLGTEDLYIRRTRAR